MVTDADFLIGLPGLVVVALMTITSWVAIRRRMTPSHWRRLHRIGIYVVWTIFFLCLVDSVGRKETAHPVLGYYAFVAVLLGRDGAPCAGVAAAAAFRVTSLSGVSRVTTPGAPSSRRLTISHARR